MQRRRQEVLGNEGVALTCLTEDGEGVSLHHSWTIEIAPKKGQAYRDGDLEAMNSGKRKSVIDKVHFCKHGF